MENTIINNWSSYIGGGISINFYGGGYIQRCLISGNQSEYGAGIHIQTSSEWEIVNCTIADNIASEWAGGIFTATFSYPEIINTIVYGNSATSYPNLFCAGDDSFNITFTDIEGGWFGEGNIDAEPLFLDPLNGNYGLSWLNFPIIDSTKSPAIDAGNPEQIYNDPDDTRNDMGAFYFNQGLPEIAGWQIEINHNDVILSWNNNPFASLYKIYASDTPYFEIMGNPIAVVTAPDSSITFSNALSEQKKYYKIIWED